MAQGLVRSPAPALGEPKPRASPAAGEREGQGNVGQGHRTSEKCDVFVCLQPAGKGKREESADFPQYVCFFIRFPKNKHSWKEPKKGFSTRKRRTILHKHSRPEWFCSRELHTCRAPGCPVQGRKHHCPGHTAMPPHGCSGSRGIGRAEAGGGATPGGCPAASGGSSTPPPTSADGPMGTTDVAKTYKKVDHLLLQLQRHKQGVAWTPPQRNKLTGKSCWLAHGDPRLELEVVEPGAQRLNSQKARSSANGAKNPLA